MARIGVYLLTALAMCLSCSPVPPPSTKLTPIQEPLPDIFGSLGWTLSAEEIEARFPTGKSRNDIPGWDGSERIIVTSVSDLTWRLFGDAIVSVARDRRRRIRWIGIESTESDDTACQPGSRQRGVRCRNEYGPTLLKLLGNV